MFLLHNEHRAPVEATKRVMRKAKLPKVFGNCIFAHLRSGNTALHPLSHLHSNLLVGVHSFFLFVSVSFLIGIVYRDNKKQPPVP